MITCAPTDFLHNFCAAFDCQDHHFTGPITAQQSEGHGSIYHLEGQILAGFARKHGGPVLEIGSDLGISSRYLAEGLAAGFYNAKWSYQPHDALAQVFCVDPRHKWDAGPEWNQIWPYHCTSKDFLKDILDADYIFSFAFIDGDHRYDGVVKDIEICQRLGIQHLLFHDTSPSCRPAVSPQDGSDARQAVLDTLGDWDLYDIPTHCGMIYGNSH